MKCKNCSRVLDGHTPISGGGKKPSAGSICICFYCSTVHVYDPQMKLREMTVEEKMEMKRADPDSYKLLSKAVLLIQKRIQSN